MPSGVYSAAAELVEAARRDVLPSTDEASISSLVVMSRQSPAGYRGNVRSVTQVEGKERRRRSERKKERSKNRETLEGMAAAKRQV